jgi:hypothetical protein
MPLWYTTPGGVHGYRVGYPSASEGTYDSEVTLFASDGIVDAGGITRLQYKVYTADGNPLPNFVGPLPPGGAPASNASSLSAIARFTFTAAELSGKTLGKIRTLMMVAPATAFPAGHVPTRAEIKSAATMWSRSWQGTTEATIGGGGRRMRFAMRGPTEADLQPNTKYWVMVIPTLLGADESLPWKDDPLFPGATLSIARGVSVWTNRSPVKPVITEPSSGLIMASGDSFDLSFTDDDPDRMSGGVSSIYTDRAGVQVQVSPAPTIDNPNPPWVDMKVADPFYGGMRDGWDIHNASWRNSGLDGFLETGTMQIKAGASTNTSGKGVLPTGSWRIRVRTFDAGNAWLRHISGLTHGVLPAGFSSPAPISPVSYPLVNTSPWSDPVTVHTPAQVPPPIPQSPIGGAAVVEELPLTLSWLYRNTALEAYPQLGYKIRYRAAGGAWIEPAPVVSAEHKHVVPAGVLTTNSGRPQVYQWQVQVIDTDGYESMFSDVATFWVVPAPGSGGTVPLPSGTTHGGTLGCGTHRVFAYRRGGTTLVGELTEISSLTWNRVRDDISESTISISGWSVDCGDLLKQLQTWAYEIVIFRDNGMSVDRVWEGPITLLKYETHKVTIKAKDVMAYSYRRIIKQRMSDSKSGRSVTSRAAGILQTVMAPDDPNVLANLAPLVSADDPKQYRTVPAYARTAFEEIDDMAANSGLDYTCAGRSILLWATRKRIGLLPEFRDSDLGETPIVTEYGMSMANRYAVGDGNGLHGEATRLGIDGADPVYGLVEMLSSSWASDSAPETGTYTQEGAQTVIRSFERFAETSIADRYPPPVVVRIPDNTSLHPDAVVSIQHLIPGVAIPLRSSGTLRTVVAMQKLDSIKVVEEDGKEIVTIAMSPFNGTDIVESGGE